MITLKEASKKLGLPYKRVSRWVRELGLGFKLGGWTVVLSEDDLKQLESRLNGSNH